MSSLRQAALKRLARREHSRFELEEKLSPLGTAEEIAAVLDHLEQTGLLSDRRMAASYLASHAGRFGLMKLRHSLRSKGIAPELIAATIAEAEQEDALDGAKVLASEEVRAHEVWRRKFAAPPANAREWGKQARFLQSRGFSSDAIRKVLKETGNGDT